MNFIMKTQTMFNYSHSHTINFLRTFSSEGYFARFGPRSYSYINNSIHLNRNNYISYRYASSKTKVLSKNNVSEKNLGSKFVTHLLSIIYINEESKKVYDNYTLQKRIESITIDEFDIMFSNNVNKYTIGGINTSILGSKLVNYINSKQETLELSIDRLKKYYLEKKILTKQKEEMFIVVF